MDHIERAGHPVPDFDNGSRCIVMLCFASSINMLRAYEVAQKLYGGTKVQIIGILRSTAPKSDGDLSFAIALDTQKPSIFDRYGVTETPTLLIYGKDGKLIHTSLRLEDALIELRNAVLYHDY